MKQNNNSDQGSLIEIPFEECQEDRIMIFEIPDETHKKTISTRRKRQHDFYRKRIQGGSSQDY
ncbi:MAG: hypothetical protein GY804_09185 [Alphaproteobacteria bacterium]|nr:hypothetical protein [Alphaproteobacteria bacterium]